MTFLCSTLWSEVIVESAAVQQGISDYHEINGYNTYENNQIHKLSVEWLETALEKVDSAVVVTHHLPTFSLISEQFAGNLLNEAFAAKMDSFINKWTDKGLKISFRISCRETSSDRIEQQFATPKWIIEAGAKGGFYLRGKRAGPNGPWEPRFDDPVFLEKLDNFL